MYETEDEDLQTLLDILGAEGISVDQSFQLFSWDLSKLLTENGLGGQAECIDFEWKPLLLVCCGSGYSSITSDTYDIETYKTGFVEADFQTIKNLPSYVIGEGEPIQ